MYTVDDLNTRARNHFPAYIGMVFTSADPAAIRAECPIRPELMGPSGYLHGGLVASVADTCAGFACTVNLPPGALGFTTIELKTNFLGTALDGIIEGVATAVHLGQSTHVWDVTVTHQDTGKTIAVFRCTQMILYPKC